MKRMAAVTTFGMLVSLSAFAQTQPAAAGDSRLFDTSGESAYRISVGQIPSSRFEGHGRSDTIEINGDWAFAYLWNIQGGDVDLNARLRSYFFTDSAGLPLPNQLAEVALNAGWTWRYSQGVGLQVRARPGVYSDLESMNGDAFRMPASCTVAKTLLPELDGFAGLEVRPGFERVFMPIVGVNWTISDVVRLKAGLPESRLTYQIDEAWSTHVGFNWQSTTFALDGEPDAVTLEDFRAFAGVRNMLTDQFGFTGEVGYIFDRSAEFEDDGEIDVEGSWFARVGLEGSF